MTSLSQAKNLGAVGSILVLLTAVPSIGGVLGIVGFVLILFAIKGIAEVVADKSIFRNMLVATGLAIAGIVTGALVIAASFFAFIGLNAVNFGPGFNPSTVPTGSWIGLIGSFIAGLVVLWALLLASAVYVRKTYGAIASKLNVRMFETAGLVYLIGAATTIILVGFALLFIAQILVTVAFFSIEEKPIEVAVLQPQPAVVRS
jgi:uncharacterized membrane protein